MEENERPIDRVSAMARWLISNEVIKSMYAFEKVCNLSKRYVKNLSATEKGNPGIDIIANIYDAFPSLNLEWMVTGKGRMWKIRGTDEEVANTIRKQLLLKLI